MTSDDKDMGAARAGGSEFQSPSDSDTLEARDIGGEAPSYVSSRITYSETIEQTLKCSL